MWSNGDMIWGRIAGVRLTRILGQTPPDVGRLGQAEGTPTQVEAGRVAHWLWWTRDLDHQADVVAVLLKHYTAPDVVWACRWGPPWASSTVARALRQAYAASGPFPLGFGVIADHLYRAGCRSTSELLVTAGALGIDDVAWCTTAMASSLPLDVEDVVSGYRHMCNLEGTDALVLSTTSLPILKSKSKMVEAFRDLCGGDATDAETLISSSPPADVAGLPFEAPSPALVEAWAEAIESREDGVERLQAATGAREAFTVLRAAADLFYAAVEMAIDSGSSWTFREDWTPGTCLPDLFMYASDCHRDAGDCAIELGDLHEAIELHGTAWELAQMAGDEAGTGKSSNNLAVAYMKRGGKEDLPHAEYLLDVAAKFYELSGQPNKLLKVAANRGFLREVRRGRKVDWPEGSRSMPWIPAHSKGIPFPFGRRRSSRA